MGQTPGHTSSQPMGTYRPAPLPPPPSPLPPRPSACCRGSCAPPHPNPRLSACCRGSCVPPHPNPRPAPPPPCRPLQQDSRAPHTPLAAYLRAQGWTEQQLARGEQLQLLGSRGPPGPLAAAAMSSGPLAVAGTLAVAGPTAVAGPAATSSGPLAVAGTLGQAVAGPSAGVPAAKKAKRALQPQPTQPSQTLQPLDAAPFAAEDGVAGREDGAEDGEGEAGGGAVGPHVPPPGCTSKRKHKAASGAKADTASGGVATAAAAMATMSGGAVATAAATAVAAIATVSDPCTSQPGGGQGSGLASVGPAGIAAAIHEGGGDDAGEMMG